MRVSPRKKNAHLTKREKEQILTLKDKRHKFTAILYKTKIPRFTVSSFINRYAKTDGFTLARKPKSGAKRILLIRTERALVRIVIFKLKIILKVFITPFKSRKRLNYYIVS